MRWTIIFAAAVLMMTGGLTFATAADDDVQRIEELIRQGEFSAAEQSIDEILSTTDDPDFRSEMLFYRGLAALYQKQPQSALEIFEDILAGQPYGVLAERVRLSLVDALYMSGDYARALAEAERVAQDYPESRFRHANLLNMARAQLRLSRWLEARDDLQQLEEKFPDTPEAHVAYQLLQERQYFAVQVGSFHERERAEEEVGRLTEQGEQAYIFDTTDRDGVKFYRVRLGRFGQLDQAQTLRDRLADLGYSAKIYP